MRRILVGALLATLVLFSAAATRNPGTFVGGSGGAAYSPVLALPESLFVVCGKEFNAWYRQLGLVFPGRDAHLVAVTCDSGGIWDRSFRYTPRTGAVGSLALGVKILDDMGNTISSGSTRLVRVLKTAGSDTADVLLVGDSLFESGVIAKHVFNKFNADGGGKIRLLGNTEEAGADSLQEGHSGATWASFTTSTGPSGPNNPYGAGINPFWDYSDGEIDFQEWMCTNGFGRDPDYCVAQLGINEVFGWSTGLLTQANYDSLTARINRFCTSLLSPTRGFPYAKIIISLPPTGADGLSAFGYGYNALSTPLDLWVNYTKNMDSYRRWLIEHYDNGTYHASVTVAPTYLWVDPQYGYAWVDSVISKHQSTTQHSYYNYVHPDSTGNYEQADAIYCAIKGVWRKASPTNLLPDSDHFDNAAFWTLTGAGAAQQADIAAPAADGDVACVNADAWQHAENTLSYFSMNPNQTVAAHNIVSCYFHKPTGVSASVGFNVVVAAGSNRYFTCVLGSAEGAYVFNAWAPWGTAQTDTSDAVARLKIRATHLGSNWYRVRMYFSNFFMSGTTLTDDLGKAISAIQIRFNALTGSMPVGTVGIRRAQFEQPATAQSWQPSPPQQRP